MNEKSVDFVNEYHFYRHIFQKVKFNSVIDGVKVAKLEYGFKGGELNG